MPGTFSTLKDNDVTVITFATAQNANPAVASGAPPEVDLLEYFLDWLRDAHSC